MHATTLLSLILGSSAALGEPTAPAAFGARPPTRREKTPDRTKAPKKEGPRGKKRRRRRR